VPQSSRQKSRKEDVVHKHGKFIWQPIRPHFQKTVISTRNTTFQSLGLETGGEMKGFELNVSKKIIALNISYFLNTTFIRYSRHQISEI
jgi:hypothetical protein